MSPLKFFFLNPSLMSENYYPLCTRQLIESSFLRYLYQVQIEWMNAHMIHGLLWPWPSNIKLLWCDRSLGKCNANHGHGHGHVAHYHVKITTQTFHPQSMLYNEWSLKALGFQLVWSPTPLWPYPVHRTEMRVARTVTPEINCTIQIRGWVWVHLELKAGLTTYRRGMYKFQIQNTGVDKRNFLIFNFSEFFFFFWSEPDAFWCQIPSKVEKWQ